MSSNNDEKFAQRLQRITQQAQEREAEVDLKILRRLCRAYAAQGCYGFIYDKDINETAIRKLRAMGVSVTVRRLTSDCELNWDKA
jgi:hypothetical protein